MSGRYTHIVKRDSGYVAGWFQGEPPADFVAECNRNIPGDPAHAEAIPEWPVCAHGMPEPADDCQGCRAVQTPCHGPDFYIV